MADFTVIGSIAWTLANGPWKYILQKESHKQNAMTKYRPESLNNYLGASCILSENHKTT